MKIFAFVGNRRYFYIFLLDLFKDWKKSKRNQRYILPFAFAVNVVLNLSNISKLYTGILYVLDRLNAEIDWN